MKRKRLQRQAVAVFVCTAVLVSCFNDVDLKNINTDISLPNALVLPVGRTRMELKNIISKMEIDSLLMMNEGESDINVVIADSVSYDFKEISLSDQIPPFMVKYGFKDYFDLHSLPTNIAVPLPLEQYISEFVTYDMFDMGVNGDETESIERARIKELAFQVEVSQNVQNLNAENIKIKIEFTEGKVRYYDGREGIVADSITPQPGTVNMFRFRNIEILPREGNDDKFPLKMTVEIYTGDVGEEPIILNAADELSVDFSVEKLDWTVAYGDFKPSVLGEGESRHDGFDLSFLSGFKFYNPQINMSIRTNVGAKFLFDVKYIKAYREDEAGVLIPGTEAQAEFDGSPSKEFSLDKRSVEPGGWSEPNIFKFDRDHGRTDLLFSNDSTPNVIEYAYAVSTAPKTAGEPERFITPNARMAVKAEAVIPLYFSANSEDKVVSISDTITSLQLDSLLPEGIELERAYLSLNLENGLPVGVVFSLAEFLDKDGRPVEVSLSQTSCTLPMPQVDDEGLFVEGSVVNKVPFNIDVTREAYDQLRKVNKIRYSVDIRQEAGKKVRFVQNNFFGLQVGVYVKGEINMSAFETNNGEE